MPSASSLAHRSLPNIALSGTPGTGKTTMCEALTARLHGFRYINVSSEAEARGCRGDYDDKLQTWEVDEVRLAKNLRKDLIKGGILLDWIHADFLAGTGDIEDDDNEHGAEEGEGSEADDVRGDVDMIDLVIQMRADTTTLYDRYEARGYSNQKIQENLDCEIMDEIGAENSDAFDAAKCVVLQGVDSDAEENVSRIVAWVAAWKDNNKVPQHD